MMGTQSETKQPEAEQIARLLELELKQKRENWKHAGERYRTIRAAAFVFLALLILGCLVGGYFAFIRLTESRPSPAANSTPGR
jgi:hypothetical protein